MRERSHSRAVSTLLLGLVLACALLGARYAGVPLPWPSVAEWLYNVIEVGVLVACAWRAAVYRPERAAWLAVSGAVACFTAADLYYSLVLADAADVPFPSLADAGYLAFYPLAYLGLALLVRAQAGSLRASVWLDGLVAGLAMAAIGAALLFPKILTSTGGDVMTVATNLAYPVGDALLLVVVVGVLTVVGVRAGTTWLLMAAGLAVFATADTIYLYQTAKGTYTEGKLLDIGWPGAMVLMALAAWRPSARLAAERLEGWRLLAIPAASGVAAIALLVRDHYVPVDAIAVWLAALSLLALLGRLGLTFAENVRMLHSSREEAATDALTGLGNRRRLLGDLERALEAGGPHLLGLYDLDGFKVYNDTFGHAAGDTLLERLGRRLASELGPEARAYRMGGDEFCVLAGTDTERAAQLVRRAAAEALSERGKGFSIGCSHGSVTLPLEAGTPGAALKLADERMYADKRSGRVSAAEQSKRVLLRAVEERNPELAIHGDGVAGTALEVARRLHLEPDDIEAVRHAAELHDIGKIAIPDSILHKTGPLDEEEWVFMRRHTAIGERIVASAPALTAAARLVRASHERYDGAGYPDGLAGTDIPLGARIIAVCDSWDAMTSDRTYRKALANDEARGELERCSGSQFDPDVVDVFLALLDAPAKRGAMLASAA